jgi:hypothetical protein
MNKTRDENLYSKKINAADLVSGKLVTNIPQPAIILWPNQKLKHPTALEGSTLYSPWGTMA